MSITYRSIPIRLLAMREGSGSIDSGARNGAVQRRRLWNVHGDLHCVFLGSCLSLDATKRILRKAKVPGLGGATDHQLHCAAVRLSKQNGPVSKLLDKALERAHRKHWAIYRRLMTPQEVRDQWHRDVKGRRLRWALLGCRASPGKRWRSANRELWRDAHALPRDRR